MILVQCRNDSKTSPVEIGIVTIEVPRSFKVLKSSSIDSYSLDIISHDNKDTLFVEYGQLGIIDDLFTPMPVIVATSEKDLLLKNFNKAPTSEEIIFSDFPKEDREQNIFDLHYYMYDTIHTIIAKIIQPKAIGKGKTGLFIPKLRNGNAISMYANNLDSTQHKQMLEIFYSLKYK